MVAVRRMRAPDPRRIDRLTRWMTGGMSSLGYRILITAAGDRPAFVEGDCASATPGSSGPSTVPPTAR